MILGGQRVAHRRPRPAPAGRCRTPAAPARPAAGGHRLHQQRRRAARPGGACHDHRMAGGSASQRVSSAAPPDAAGPRGRSPARNSGATMAGIPASAASGRNGRPHPAAPAPRGDAFALHLVDQFGKAVGQIEDRRAWGQIGLRRSSSRATSCASSSRGRRAEAGGRPGISTSAADRSPAAAGAGTPGLQRGRPR
jgi:hypothetical protein